MDISLFNHIAYDHALIGQRLYLLAIAMWAVFSIYWDAAAKNAAASQSSEASGSRAVHVFLANAALILELAPIQGLGRLWPVMPWIMIVGLAVESGGLCLAIWARRHLGRNWSGKITIKVDHQLVRSGPYRTLRHPIYTGLLAMYAGVLLVTGERLAVIGLAMAVYAYWRKIRLEEANMDVAFPADYAAYRKETWALVPGLF